MFFRMATDRSRTPVSLEGLYAGDPVSTCWIVGGGPSLAAAPLDAIVAGPAPTFAVNLAGSRRLRPTFWTAYDATARFHRSTYLDAGTLKFVQARRAMDLVPETTHKLCDAPATVFFETEPHRMFSDWLAPGRPLVDWADSLVQAIAIAVQLGFRRLLLVGCDLRVQPSAELKSLARRHDVTHDPGQLLRTFVADCRAAGLTDEQLSTAARPTLYHFDESKPLAAAVDCDAHYDRIAQTLRLCRRSLATAGVELISATPGSRLNTAFRYESPASLLKSLHATLGDRSRERERGRYELEAARLPAGVEPMRDYPPYVRPKRQTFPEAEPVAVD